MSARIRSIFTELGFVDEGRGPYARAVERGASASNLGEAFYEGYQCALTRLLSDEVASRRGSFCVTERGGGHPKAMQCAMRVDGDSVVLDGEKSFVTGADRAELLFVVARSAMRDDGRPELHVVRVPVDSPGVRLEPLPKAPFATTVDHARVMLASVRVPRAAVLEGDGYVRYVKPFRTVEDVHVLGAIVAHLAAFLEAVEGERERVERLLGVAVALDAIASRAPDSPATHLALAGVLAWLRETAATLDEAIGRHPDAGRGAELRRDLALLTIAESVRRARRDTAWAAFD